MNSQIMRQPINKKLRNKHDVLTFGTLNCIGLNCDLKKRQICTDLEDYKIDFLSVQETHMKESGELELESIKCNKYKFYHSGTQTNNFTGVGILVRNKDLNCVFTVVSERICFITFQYENTKYLLINAY